MDYQHVFCCSDSVETRIVFVSHPNNHAVIVEWISMPRRWRSMHQINRAPIIGEIEDRYTYPIEAVSDRPGTSR